MYRSGTQIDRSNIGTPMARSNPKFGGDTPMSISNYIDTPKKFHLLKLKNSKKTGEIKCLHFIVLCFIFQELRMKFAYIVLFFVNIFDLIIVLK